MDEKFAPKAHEKLYISKLEIGTPNFIEFLAPVVNLMQVVAFLGGMLAILKAIKEIITIPADVKIRYLEAKNKELEHQMLKLELDKMKKEAEGKNIIKIEEMKIISENWKFNNLEELLKANKISKEIYKHKKKMEAEIKKLGEFFLPKIIKQNTKINFSIFKNGEMR